MKRRVKLWLALVALCMLVFGSMTVSAGNAVAALSGSAVTVTMNDAQGNGKKVPATVTLSTNEKNVDLDVTYTWKTTVKKGVEQVVTAPMIEIVSSKSSVVAVETEYATEQDITKTEIKDKKGNVTNYKYQATAKCKASVLQNGTAKIQIKNVATKKVIKTVNVKAITYAEGIQITNGEKVSDTEYNVIMGKTAQFKLATAFTNENVTNKKVTFSVQPVMDGKKKVNTGITVNSQGVITAKASKNMTAPYGTIIVKSGDKKCEIKVNVTTADVAATAIKAQTDVTKNYAGTKSELAKLYKNNQMLLKTNSKNTYELKILANGKKDANNGAEVASKDLLFVSSNTKVATVDESGVITAVGNGKVVIKVSLKYDIRVKTSVTVNVCTDAYEITSANAVSKDLNKDGTISDDEQNVITIVPTKDKKTGKLSASVNLIKTINAKTNADATNKNVAYYVNNKKVSSVSMKNITDGDLSTKKVVVTVKTADGVTTKLFTLYALTEEDNKAEEEQPEVKDDYKLIFEDNFDGDALNREKWNVELHQPGWVNNELQEYVDSDKNIYVQDGKLIIQALKDENGNYTSGRVNTQNKVDFKYGKVEVSAKVPSGQGFLPAAWMMPTNENLYGQWPKCGEIDIMEVLGSDTKKSYSTLHYGEPHEENQGTYTLAQGDFSEEFHKFTCEWEPGKIQFYVDDVLMHTATNWFSQKEGFDPVAYPAPYDQPFYVILNLAVGGNWPGNPNADTQFGENARLTVDYVKVFQKDSYDENVEKPEIVVELRDPDANGNYVYNGDFSDAESLEDDVQWKFLTALGGVGSAEIKDNTMVIKTEDAGTVDYSIQLVQAGIPMEKGMKYELSFDAWADADRTMITDITAPDKGYKRYLADTKLSLTTEKQSYSYTFAMKDDSDANGRVEYNLGNQGSTATVYIQNVKLVKVGEVEQVEEAKTVLPDGNYVYNGDFSSGKNRMDYWTVESTVDGASAVVTNANNVRECVVTVPATIAAEQKVVLSQKELALGAAKKYLMTFDARADKEMTLQADVAGVAVSQAITTEMKTYKIVLETPETLVNKDLSFVFGEAGVVTLDNIRIQEDALLLNGDFSNGMTGYEVYAYNASDVTYTVDSLNEDNAFSIDIDQTGSQDWYIQLKQNGIKLEQDQWYRISMDAKASMDRKIMIALQRDGSSDDDWTPYSGSQKMDLTNTYSHFSHEFKMSNATDEKTILSISMGAVDGIEITKKHSVVIDNIKLEKIDAPAQEEISQEVGVEVLNNVSFSNNAEGWINGISAPGEATATFENGVASYDITSVGTADWNVQLKQEGVTLVQGNQYQYTMKVTSSVARTIKACFLSATWDYYGGEDIVLEAGVEKQVDFTFTMNKASDKNTVFVISMGKIEGADTPAGQITLSDISLKRVDGTAVNPVDPAVSQQVGDEMIKNPSFDEGNADWETTVADFADAVGSASFEEGKAIFNIENAGSQDWHFQLKQSNLTLIKGNKYAVKMHLTSTSDRDVRLAIMSNDFKSWYAGEDAISLKANEAKEYIQEFVMGNDTDTTAIFLLSMGKVGTPAPGVITVDDVSITCVAVAGEEATEPEETETVVQEIGAELLNNGNFASKDGWICGIWGDGAGTGAIADGKAVFDITNVGTADWNIQLKREDLQLVQGNKYHIVLHINSEVARTIRLAFINAKDTSKGYLYYDFQVNAGDNEIKYDFDMTSSSDLGVAFAISMGKNGDDCKPGKISLSDLSVKRVE